jgi:hypothetical protein
MLGFLLGLFRLVWLFEKGHQAVVLDNLALRQQLSVYKRRQKRPRLVGRDRWFWIALSEVWTEWRRALCIVHPDTSGALAARKIRTGAAFKQIGTGRASPQFSHSHIDSHFGGSQSLVVCVPHSWRTEEARNRGLRTDGVAHPADRQAATLADLENLPPESCRRARRDRCSARIVCGDFRRATGGAVHGYINFAAKSEFRYLCHWFDYQHHSMLVDLCEEPLALE